MVSRVVSSPVHVRLTATVPVFTAHAEGELRCLANDLPHHARVARAQALLTVLPRGWHQSPIQ
jgi:hypothetical protein